MNHLYINTEITVDGCGMELAGKVRERKPVNLAVLRAALIACISGFFFGGGIGMIIRLCVGDGLPDVDSWSTPCVLIMAITFSVIFSVFEYFVALDMQRDDQAAEG